MFPSKIALSLALTLPLAACANPARPEFMVPEGLVPLDGHDASVHLTADGGKETNPLWSSQVSNESMLEALTVALEQTGLFRTVLADPDGAEYVLDVQILDLDQPAAGFDMTVTMTARWTLTAAATGQLVMEEFVDTAYTATVGDAFAGTARIRVANEGAARENIRQALERLARLELAAGVTP